MEKLIPSSWRVELEDELTKLMSENDSSSDVTMFNTLVHLIDHDILNHSTIDKHLIKVDVIKRLIRIKGLNNRPLFDSYLITVWRILVCPSEKSVLEDSDRKTRSTVDYLYGLLGYTIRMSDSWDPPKDISEGKMVSYLNVQATVLKKSKSTINSLNHDPLVLILGLMIPKMDTDYMALFVKAWNKSYQDFPNFLQISELISSDNIAIEDC